MSLVSRFASRRRRAHTPGRYHAHAPELSTPEFVDRAYQVILGRKADPNGMRINSEAIDSGKKTRSHLVYDLIGGAEFKADNPDVRLLDDHDFVSLTFQALLGRKASAAEVEHHTSLLVSGKMTRGHFAYKVLDSAEFKKASWTEMDFWHTVRRSRSLVVSQLPKADRIVELGGSRGERSEGALVDFGYPYRYESLSVVSPPRGGREETGAENPGPVDTPIGPVNYVASPPADLSAFADGSADLVYAGQSIERLTTGEAAALLKGVHRVLRSGGHFCLDTPNRDVTKFGFPNFIVDDHKHEYTHAEMTAALEAGGFEVREAKGLVLMDRTAREGRFLPEESLGRDRLYDDIEGCFLLYYKARKA